MVLNTTGNDVERLMRDGQAAAKRGDKVMARALLTQVLERDPHNEKAWMWLSGAVGDPYEQLTCLENVLIINPNNAQARKGLEFVVASTGTRSQVLDTLNASPPAPVPQASQPGDDPFAGAVPASQPQYDLSQPAPSGPALSPAGDPGLWSRPISEYTSPLQDAPEFPDYPQFTLPDPGAGLLPPWEQIPPQPPPASASEQDLPWGVGNTLSPNLTNIGLDASAQSALSAPENGALPMPDLDHLTDGWDPATQSFSPAPATGAAPAAADPFAAYAGGPATPGLPPDFEAAVPDWVRQAQAPASLEPHDSAGQGADPFDLSGVEPFSPFEPQPEGRAVSAPGSLPAEDVAAVENGIDAWLNQVAAHQAAQEASGLPPTNFPMSSSPTQDDTRADHDSQVRDPFAAGDLGPMGPYSANALPSPDELPGSYSTGGHAQPWYLQGSSSEQIESPPDTQGDHNWTTYGNYSDGQAEQAQAPREPVATIECPNCRKQVPETSLACPECRYNFFVHCPGCHELVDTTEAKMGVVDSCPYCSIPVNRFELGLMYAKDLSTPVLAAPTEDKDAWVGTVMEPPKQGFHFNLAWVVDVLWLLAIALVVWALTQLPAWFNMTNLYN